MHKIILLFFLTTGCYQWCNAQEVEHNFLVGPQLTSCDSMSLENLSIPESINNIRGAKFRFDQNFRLTRTQGLQAGEYFSCDNKVGYMIIKYDGIEYLYETVDKKLWHELISSSDPEGFYIDNRNLLQERIEWVNNIEIITWIIILEYFKYWAYHKYF